MDRRLEVSKIVQDYMSSWAEHAWETPNFHKARRDTVGKLRKLGLTYAEIADWLGISRQRAQQIGAEG